MDEKQLGVLLHVGDERVLDGLKLVVAVAHDVVFNGCVHHLIVHLFETDLSHGEMVLVFLRILFHHFFGGFLRFGDDDKLRVSRGRHGFGRIGHVETRRSHANERSDGLHPFVSQQDFRQ